MAVQHPVSGIVSDKLEISRLSHAHQYRVFRPPTGFRLAPSFAASDVESVAMQVNRMVIHAEIHESKAHTITQTNNERSGSGTGFAVEC